MSAFAVLAVLVVVLAVVLTVALLRLLAAARREGRLAREENLASVAALLRAPEKATRLYALSLLSSFPLVELSAIEAPLEELFRDHDPEISAAARRLVLLIHPPGQLLRQLGGRQVPEKLEAIEGLAAVGGQKALAGLLEAAARSPEAEVRQAARSALAGVDCPELFLFLITALGSSDPILRTAAKEAFQSCGLRALPSLISALRDPRKSLRLQAAELIGDLTLHEAAESLISLLGDPVDEVRAQAARSLGKLSRSGAGAVAALEQSLGDHSGLVREEAAASLAALGDQGALVPLLEFLRRRREVGTVSYPPVSVIQFIARNFPAEPAAFSAWRLLIESADEALLAMLAKVMEQLPETVHREWLERLPALPEEMKEILHDLFVRLGRAGLRAPFRSAVSDRSSSKSQVRAEVARILGEAGNTDLGEELAALLSDPESSVRRRAAWAAGRVLHLAAIDALCQALSDPAAEVRMEAAGSLAHLLEQAQSAQEFPEEMARRLAEQAGSALLQAVNDPSDDVRAKIAVALGATRLAAAVPSLTAWALGDTCPTVRAAAADALVRAPSGDALPLLAEALSYQGPELRLRAAEILGRLGDPAAVPHLIRSLQDDAAAVREAAARSLWEIGSAGHIDALLVHLQSPEAKIRASIAGLLGKVQAEQALEGLSRALRDPNEFVRAAVVNAMTKFGEMASDYLPLLIERLEDPDDFVRARAVRAIAAVGGSQPPALRALSEAVNDRDPAVFSEALGAMVELAAQGVLEPLAEALAEPRARAAAGEMLAYADPAVLRRLLAAAREARSEAQRELLPLLAETIRSLGGVEGYRKDLASVEPAMRLAALEALSLLGTEEAAEAVVEVLKNDPVAQVRQRAAIILGRMPGEAAQSALRQAVESDLAPEVKEAARAQVRLSS